MKVYDGSTEQLFERYQNSKRITLVFEELTKIEIPETLAEKCRILEDNGYKKCMKCLRRTLADSWNTL